MPHDMAAFGSLSEGTGKDGENLSCFFLSFFQVAHLV
jgi:hypothetical protein